MSRISINRFKLKSRSTSVMFPVVFFAFFLGASTAIQVTPEPESAVSPDFETGYFDYDQITQFMWEIAKNYSEFASLYSIGRSVEQRELWVLKIKSSKTPILGAPHVKFVGNIHGNEPVGRQLILYLAEYLVKNYKTDSEVKWILDRTVIHLLPSLNPDGFEKSKEGECYTGPGRGNGNNVDLNRSFPGNFHENKIPAQPETLAVDQWLRQIPFSLSASFHGGALVANYPYDNNPQKDLVLPHASLTPDQDVFKYLAETYSNNHLTMYKGRTCDENQPSFPGGVTNGAAWYSFTGGMQDFNYVFHGCMELTLEISCCKYPTASHLPRLWAENKKAMLELMKQAHRGVRGLILNKETSAYIAGAVLRIGGRDIPFTSSKNGEFWRILLPGDYVLVAEAVGFEAQAIPFTVDKINETHPASTWLNVFLQPINSTLNWPTLGGIQPSSMVQVDENSANLNSLSLYLPICWIISFFVIT